MKYLFDVLTKNTQTLAGLYKYTKEGDEFRVYDPELAPIEGFDVRLLGRLEKQFKYDKNGLVIKDGEPVSVLSVPELNNNDVKIVNNVHTYTKEIDDSRKMLSTLDFDKALDWCDVYVTMYAPEASLALVNDTHKELKKADIVLSHITAAMNKKKKVFLGNRENDLYRQVLNEYEGCLNHIIDKKDLDEMKKYKGAFFEDAGNRTTRMTFVISTSGAAGKMSNVLKIRNSFEMTGETTAVIVTEEIADFLDKDKHHIYPFLREFCDISLDEEILYLRCLIEKIVNEVNPDRILMTGQGGFGLQPVITEYTPDDCKPRGVLGNIMLSAIGCDSVALAAHFNEMFELAQLVRYFRTTNKAIDEVCISPVIDTLEKDTLTVNDLKIPVNKIGEYDRVFQAALTFMIRFPQIPMFCNYMGITDKLNALVLSNEFFDIWKNQAVMDLLNALNTNKQEFIRRTGNAAFNNAIGKTLADMSNDNVQCSDELWKKVAEEASKLKL